MIPIITVWGNCIKNMYFHKKSVFTDNYSEKGLNKEEKQNLKDVVKSIYSPRRLADGEAMMCEIQGAQEDFVRRWEMCFREYPDILTEPKNNEKLLVFIDRASRYLQTVKDRLNSDGNHQSQC